MHEHPPWDETALAMVDRIEKAIVHLRLDSQGQFVAILNAIEMQIESGDPCLVTVANLGDALLNLAEARGVDVHKLQLPQLLQALLDRLLETAGLGRPGR